MKKILLISLFIVLIGCEPQKKNDSKPIESIKIENLEIALTDLGSFTWSNAQEECSKLGDGWRLPTKDELTILYQNKDKIGGFEVGYYWSSTEFNDDDAYKQFFTPGPPEEKPSYGPKIYNNYVRAVRAF
jgi:hypothetical protein